MDTYGEGFGFRLWLARVDRGISRRELGMALHRSEATIARWERAPGLPRNCTQAEREIAARTLDVPADWLVDGTEVPGRKSPRIGHRGLCAIMAGNWVYLDSASAEMLADMIRAAVNRARKSRNLPPLPGG
jgi:transcriptional regulator with XRE-family HTH domain